MLSPQTMLFAIDDVAAVDRVAPDDVLGPGVGLCRRSTVDGVTPCGQPPRADRLRGVDRVGERDRARRVDLAGALRQVVGVGQLESPNTAESP